ncbi:MAG: NUDIX domain-containing protein, partial [Planctomycetota bacterium]|nr:NUDIX domain-containing protein [Planctomycetota bacterium]
MWSRRARFCPLCSSALAIREVGGRPRPRCLECRFVLYENPASASAGLVLDPDGRVLLVRRAIEPFKGLWAIPAGYQEADEDPPAAVVREVREETAIDVRVVRLVDLIHVPDDARKPANVAVYLCRGARGAPPARHHADADPGDSNQ